MALKLVALAMLVTAQSLTIERRTHTFPIIISGDHIQDDNVYRDSKPGTPVVPRWEGKALLKEDAPWRTQLGARLFKAATVDEKTLKSCGSMIAFGDSSWCMKAMPEQTLESPLSKRRGFHIYDVQNSTRKPAPKAADLLALSYGIQGSDLWSETMSNVYSLKTRLFDCYFAGPEGPMTNDLYSSAGCAKSVGGLDHQRACYATPYEANHVCLYEGTNDRMVAKNGREYEPIKKALKDRKRLSVHLKMDVEGSEWLVLEKLLKNDGEMAKIRTLDMEVHMQMDPTPDENNPRMDEEGVARRVAIMEGLAEKFAVTGSDIEYKHKNLHKQFTEGQKANPNFQAYAGQPHPVVYTKDGFSLDQYVISYVNRQLL